MSPGFLDESWISAWFTQICFSNPCHGNCYWLLAPNIQIASPMSTPSSPVGKKSFPNRSPRKYKRRGAKCTRPTLSGSTSINYKPFCRKRRIGTRFPREKIGKTNDWTRIIVWFMWFMTLNIVKVVTVKLSKVHKFLETLNYIELEPLLSKISCFPQDWVPQPVSHSLSAPSVSKVYQ